MIIYHQGLFLEESYCLNIFFQILFFLSYDYLLLQIVRIFTCVIYQLSIIDYSVSHCILLLLTSLFIYYVLNIKCGDEKEIAYRHDSDQWEYRKIYYYHSVKL